MSEKIKFQCPFCESKLSIGREQAGKNLKCPKCQQFVRVPYRDSDSEGLESIFEPDPKTDDEGDVAAKRFVVRFAPDVVSKPMKADYVIEALEDGKLLPGMLFAEEGTEDWLPLTFIMPEKKIKAEVDEKRNREILAERLEEIESSTKVRFGPSFFLLALGILMLIPAVETGSAGERGILFALSAFLLSVWFYFSIFNWVNQHFRRTKLLLSLIAEQTQMAKADPSRE